MLHNKKVIHIAVVLWKCIRTALKELITLIQIMSAILSLRTTVVPHVWKELGSRDIIHSNASFIPIMKNDPIIGFRSLIKMLALNQLVSKACSSVVLGFITYTVHF